MLRAIIRANGLRSYSSGCDFDRAKRGLVVGLYQREDNVADAPRLTATGEIFDSRTDGCLMNLIKEHKLTGKLCEKRIFSNINGDFGSVAVVGLGREGVRFNELEAIDEGMENVRVAAGLGAKSLQKEGCETISVDSMEYPEQAAEGSSLAIWQYQENKMKKNRKPLVNLELYESPEQDPWMKGLFKADAQNLARTLCDAPANKITPTLFAQAAVDALCPCGVSVDVRNMDWIESQNMTSFLAVGKSSCEPPVFLEINYCGNESNESPVLMVGQGITFNSGGLCLKKPEGMEEYRGAMSGAACVIASIRAAAALSLPINIVGVIPLCENMPSGMAFKPGDVITCLNGKSIAVHDTNNAGRLIMADTFCYGQTVYKPKLVVDVATLTQGVTHTLGGAAAGVFSNSHAIWHEMHKAGAITGDRMWRLPLWNYYTNKVTNYTNVDISNTGHGRGSACLGAAFLREFVPCVDWIHLDISGVGMLKHGTGLPYLENGRMTGRPTRTLIQFLHQLACADERFSDVKAMGR